MTVVWLAAANGFCLEPSRIPVARNRDPIYA
jgi:hypothetical protein